MSKLDDLRRLREAGLKRPKRHKTGVEAQKRPRKRVKPIPASVTPSKAAEAPPASPLSAGAILGRLGGPARARALTPERRQEIARQAARARWPKK